MKAILMNAAGAAEVLVPAEVPTPELGGGKNLRVRIHAAGVNPLDTKIRKLHFYYPKNLPVILGCDGAGVVDDVGRAGLALPPRRRGVLLQWRPWRGARDVRAVLHRARGLCGAQADAVVDGGGRCRSAGAHHRVGSARRSCRTALRRNAAGARWCRWRWPHRRAARAVPGRASRGHRERRRQGRTGEGPRRGACHRLPTADRSSTRSCAGRDGHGTDVVFDTVGGPPFCQSFAALRLYGSIATLLSTACELSDVNRARLRNLIVGYVQMTAPMFLGDVEGRRAQTRILEEGRAPVRQWCAEDGGQRRPCRSTRRRKRTAWSRRATPSARWC